jgi:SAM-dependent methyltransferase
MTVDDNRFENPRFPRSGGYDPRWVAENQMGPNALWLAEWLSERVELAPGMRVLDLGCGSAMSSIFLAREHGATVFATDLWIPASENWGRIREAGLEDRVIPIQAEAHALPFAPEYFDAIVSLDSYSYYGTDDLYLSYVSRFLRPGGQIGIVTPGLVEEIEEPPPHLLRPQKNGRVFWEPDCWTFHTPAWWRRHWERSGLVEVELAEPMPDGWRHWAQHERAVEASGLGVFPSDEEVLLEDAGRTICLLRVVARKEQAAPKGDMPHVWEPAFASVCAELRSGRKQD